ncbi:MAG: nucleotidyltransferase family protein [Clostridia bacterium]|nr:nucleotidyltransferase family protein [Clostridia bacterium]
MDERTERVFFALLRSAIREEPLKEEYKKSITDNSAKSMLVLAKKHDVAVMLAHALEKNGCLFENEALAQALQKEIMMSVYRYEQFNYELQNICRVFDESKIFHVPLKGSVLRQYYPIPWLRTSCDIDVLVKRGDIEKAKAALSDALHYEIRDTGSHDVSMFSPSGIHLELHFDLNEPKSKSYDTLSNVWEHTHANTENSYTLALDDDVFYLYHIIHMSKHFLNGGCGIRPFIDLWLLNDVIEGDRQKREELLKHENIFAFANATGRLANVWMTDIPHTEISRKTQNYVLSGGVYGNIENKVQLQQSKAGGKLRFAFSKVFLPYEAIKYYYPSLQRHRWLTPFMQVHRWFKILFSGGAKRSVRTLQLNHSIGADEKRDTELFLSQIGL